jgi:hypothetical protein
MDLGDARSIPLGIPSGLWTGLVNQEWLLTKRVPSPAEDPNPKSTRSFRIRRSDSERDTLAESVNRLGRTALKDVARVAPSRIR